MDAALHESINSTDVYIGVEIDEIVQMMVEESRQSFRIGVRIHPVVFECNLRAAE